MAEDGKKSELEQRVESALSGEKATQTAKKRSFVSTEQAAGAGRTLVSPTDILLYNARKLSSIEKLLKELLDLKRTQMQLSPAKGEKGKGFVEDVKKSEPPAIVIDAKLEKFRTALAQYLLPDTQGKADLRIDTEEATMYYVVYFNRFLGSKKFGEISEIMKQFDGRYVSQGKTSHFNVPKQG